MAEPLAVLVDAREQFLAAGLVTAIRDFRYVPYIAAEAELEILA